MRHVRASKLSYKDVITGIAIICTLFLAGEYRIVGFVGFALLLGVNISQLLNNNWKINLNSKLSISIILNILYLLAHMISSVFLQRIYNNTLYSFVMQLMIYTFLLILIGKNTSPLEVTRISKVYSLLFSIILIYIYLKDIAMLEYSYFFEYQLGMLMLVTTCFFILRKKNKKMTLSILAVTVTTIYLSTRRGPLLAFLGFIFTNLIWNKICKSRKIYSIYFIAIVLGCLVFPFIYLSLSEPSSTLGAILNSLTIDYTGSRMFSGRDILWPYVIETIKYHPIWGSGVGVTLSYFYNEITLSTHNLNLFILMQTGLIGLILFYLMLYSFWLEYFKNEVNYSRVFGSLLIAIIIQQTFSLGLLSGKMALALPVWTLIAYGVYKSYREKKDI